MTTQELTVTLRDLHAKQWEIKNSPAKRKVVRAGRRGGKTTLAADIAVDIFLEGGRVLYGVPTDDQVGRFWFECKRALAEPIEAGVYSKNETKHIIELPGTEQRIRAKTAYNADTLRGDYGDYIILDEFQLMEVDTLDEVVYPMLLDNNGDLMLIFTERRGHKGKYARELFAKHKTDPRWQSFLFTSHDNPHISKEALQEITKDMTMLAYKAEIMAEESGDNPDALWKRDMIQRLTKAPELSRIVIGVDPPGSVGTECGIVAAGKGLYEGRMCGFVLGDYSLKGSPGEWGAAVVTPYHGLKADRVVGEKNYGGDMVENTITTVENGKDVAYKGVTATRGKTVRAEPIAALYENHRVYHVGVFEQLEDELCGYVPDKGLPSPNRYDGMVWALTELLLGDVPPPAGEQVEINTDEYKPERKTIWQR